MGKNEDMSIAPFLRKIILIMIVIPVSRLKIVVCLINRDKDDVVCQDSNESYTGYSKSLI